MRGKTRVFQNGFFTDPSNMCVGFLFADPVKRIEFKRIERKRVVVYKKRDVMTVMHTCVGQHLSGFHYAADKIFILSKILFLQLSFINNNFLKYFSKF